MKTNRLRIVLDTNVFLVSLAEQSPYSIIFDALLEGKFELTVHNEIITEYEEVIGKRYDKETVSDVLELILHLDNIYRQEVYYQWGLIPNDPDDNKFVDVCVASQSDYLVSNDKHFNILKTTRFPPVNLINAENFIQILSELS
ncbi:putative PIN family toxin of toxin-antitoxin system [Runella defluvii]|uniref:Putative PIN family toxin of toxin-antitoxin system n=1 Tax=Runella defluvii TaxID=370973 RepID=A0A7W6ENI1_9BACT|nr:putative toxin-antitoxin system toxin component, PIN family [Runella defluvii]MBB3836282.1 putative PIN family toxin of toxin-antitoxin system [Runella defluvii]